MEKGFGEFSTENNNRVIVNGAIGSLPDVLVANGALHTINEVLSSFIRAV